MSPCLHRHAAVSLVLAVVGLGCGDSTPPADEPSAAPAPAPLVATVESQRPAPTIPQSPRVVELNIVSSPSAGRGDGIVDVAVTGRLLELPAKFPAQEVALAIRCEFAEETDGMVSQSWGKLVPASGGGEFAIETTMVLAEYRYHHCLVEALLRPTCSEHDARRNDCDTTDALHLPSVCLLRDHAAKTWRRAHLNDCRPFYSRDAP